MARRRTPRDPEGRMTLGEHFREFRNRLVKSALAVVVGGVVGWIVYDPLYDVLTTPINDYIAAHPDRAEDIKLTLSGITTAFSLHFTVAIFVGLILASPVWLYQVWAFIVPGLTRKEKRTAMAFIGAAVPLFLGGIALAHFSLPLVIGVLLDFTPAGAANFQAASDYINFVTRFSLGFGLAFLLPVFLVALNVVGLLPSRAMIKAWRVAVVAIAVFSAMMMPTPDPYSMFLLMGPLVALYFAAIGVSRLLERRKKQQRPDWLDVDDTEASEL
ncbi:twin-arginine translocase subunit TatC [Phycicoccus endophyticus]|uniref:Sec-independent protein translocase protein TatC n=1 Tax=Phycicoccus endophyticus TaxID=1690220 RepID=A0A7G9R4J9_9MICO|nr:twin-arginine translocase subunit TatC [Phycicoccus endophyticus]NHI18415.1 twin-arginine translocase subunit TatC [Phycicoccus endophyticus]QNN50524.1 twin-arginine translocase subunit TatC [Phycicoccus endophyticus]GGL23991.1 Sec-independent protein translocase protein TatC [Phycicoccus endophyticus]